MNNLLHNPKTLLKNRKGFTLIELIVVIVIIGILAAIVVPRLTGFSETAKQKADIASGKTIATAALTLYTSNGTMAADPAALVTAGLLDTNPKAQTIQGKGFKMAWDTTTSSAGITVSVDTGKEVYPDPGF